MTRIDGVLHREAYGAGPEVVFVHGWGMHSAVWRDFAQSLAGDYRITLIDLPGHGLSGMVEDLTLPGLSRALAAVAPARAHWVGWSLGAQVALHLAAHEPERVSSLTLLAGTARFTTAADWPAAMPLERLERFAAEMLSDYHQTLMNFLGLQTLGLENAHRVLKDLRERVAECAEPDVRALRAGLEILRHADLRPLLAQVKVPVLLLLGARDRLVPKEAGESMRRLLPSARVRLLEGAAHVPFLTHGPVCAACLRDFWRGCHV